MLAPHGRRNAYKSAYPPQRIDIPLTLLAGQTFTPVLPLSLSESSGPARLTDIFEATVNRFPDHRALECRERTLTYAQLDDAANRLACFLRSRGVSRGSFVALWLPRDEQMHIALLAALKAGAAYVPLDPEYPAERVRYIVENCRVQTLLTMTEMARQVQVPAQVVCLDAEQQQVAAQSSRRLKPSETGVTSDDLAYVIYTSGSTGRPKGVMIEQRSACNLVEAEHDIFQVQPGDRVFQGFSLAFDASVEEIWLAYRTGATLVVGTHEMLHAGPDLANILANLRITVWSTVPTLLSLLEDDIPSLRLLILGGEQCPPDLVNRWSRPARRLVNTYGPTEATVIATYGDLTPGQPVTIGRPVPNYAVYLLDENLQMPPLGRAGELHIGGVGLARGYVGLPEQTAQKFIANPLREEDHARFPRLYKSGDLCRFNEDGNLEFLGRIDSQVKIRGFRVELSEIEAVLLEAPGVLAAAATLREDAQGIQQLVGYVVPRDQASLHEEELRALVRSRLPSYMTPALFEIISEFPTLPSGKIDRARLPQPRPRDTAIGSRPGETCTRAEGQLLESWRRLFAPAQVSLDDNFFLDLGGHSLLAARMVSLLRKVEPFQRLSMLDVYQHPTIRDLAAALDQPSPAPPAAKNETAAKTTTSLRYFLCGAAQSAALYFVLGFFSLQWLAPYLAYTWFIEDGFGIDEALLGAMTALAAVYPVMLSLAVAAKWLLLGRVRAGRYPLWGWFYFRWWLANAIMDAVPISYLAGTPLLPIFYRLLGAKIGPHVYLGSDNLGAVDLIEIGADSSISGDSSLDGYSVEDGWLHLGPIRIGQGCYVGTRAVVRENTRIEAGARLEDLSMLPRGAVIPAGETWAGSPASPLAKVAPPPVAPRPTLSRRFWFGVAHAVGVMIFPLLAIAAIFPGMVLMNHLNALDPWYYYLVLSPAVAVSFVVFMCLEIAAVKWMLLGRVTAGSHSLYSGFYLRKWFVDRLLELSLETIGPLYSTIYLAPWYRLLGAKIGKRAEISTASFISPDLLTLDDESFIADVASLGAHRVENGLMTVAGNHIGKRSFIGNSALLPPGAVIGDNCLIGCLSTTPRDSQEAAIAGTSWVGSPAVFLPQRQAVADFPLEQTFSPTASLYAQRAFIEFWRITLPPTCFIALTSVLLSYIAFHRDDEFHPYPHGITFVDLLLVFPLLYGGCAVAAGLFVVGLKWLVMGRYRPDERPLWSHFVWRSEMITALHDYLAVPFIAHALCGTPLICWYFRLMGAKIGRRVYMNTVQLTEFDLVEVGDDACLNSDATLQTHLFEDRVMKMSYVRVGPACNVGAQSLVLYDTQMEAGSTLGDLSLLMKGETLPAGTRWQGIPATAEERAP